MVKTVSRGNRGRVWGRRHRYPNRTSTKQAPQVLAAAFGVVQGVFECHAGFACLVIMMEL